MARLDTAASVGGNIQLQPLRGLGWYIDGVSVEPPATFALQASIVEAAFVVGEINEAGHPLNRMTAVVIPIGASEKTDYYLYADTDATLSSRARSMPFAARVVGFVRVPQG